MSMSRNAELHEAILEQHALSPEAAGSKIRALQKAMRELPQLTELETRHYFAGGMYARELFRPAGTLIVGKLHRRSHFYIVTKGRVQVASDEGSEIYEAPAVIVSKPGTKRAVLALEDSVCMTIHRTNNTDLDEIEPSPEVLAAIERELIEPEEGELEALFDSGNNLKHKEITS